MLRSVHISGYRSLRDFRITLGKVTMITGENGVGKSNVYKALALMQQMAAGKFASTIAEEGGFPSMLWAGERRKTESHRVCWALDHEDFHLEMECGMVPASPGDPSAFRLDPDIKLESLRLGGAKGRMMAQRKSSRVELRSADGGKEWIELPGALPESMLSEIRDAVRFPAVFVARDELLSWRFYHHFATDPGSPLRRSSIGFWSPILEADGRNFAANLQTLREAGRTELLNEAVERAFPGCLWSPMDETGGFQLRLLRPGLKRWLNASELSDGTLRFFCLCAALLTTRPPPLLVINEPETSLHPELMAPLAWLISHAAAQTQILLVTHSRELASEITTVCETRQVELISINGETKRTGQNVPGLVWASDEES